MKYKDILNEIICPFPGMHNLLDNFGLCFIDYIGNTDFSS